MQTTGGSRSKANLCALLLFWVAAAICAPAQTFTKLADLGPSTGEAPSSPLVQGFDGNLYGTAAASGLYGGGTFFRITPSGAVTTLYNFCFNDNSGCPDGDTPSGAIALGPDGNFYGTTAGDFFGSAGSGTIYKITPAGTLTTLHTFCQGLCSDGAFPKSGLTLAWNGDFYGTSFPPEESGAYDNLVFKVSPTGDFKTILVVCPNQICPVNAGPVGTLLQASGGNLVGAGPGGSDGAGAIYRMTPLGKTSTVISLCADSSCHFGSGANTPIIENQVGDFITTTSFGGRGKNCTLSQGCGTAFYEYTYPTHPAFLNKIHDFCLWKNCGDGAIPTALTIGTDHAFYGAATAGGALSGDGTVFRLACRLGDQRCGIYSVLHTFTGNDGSAPTTSVLQATDGNFYGTTSKGGANGGGTIFRISTGLPPFVKTVQGSGKAGDSIIVLGNNLTGATSVTFNGTAATFAVVSATEITATIPTGATTGKIQVVTPSTTLSTNVAFTVLH